MSTSPEQRRRAKTRQDIIDTAYRMIVDEGLQHLSIRALADKIDYSPAALYRYFGSKDELIDVVRAACFEKLNIHILSRIVNFTTAAAQLLEGGLAYIEFAAQFPADYQLMFQLGPSTITNLEHRNVTMQALNQIVQMGIESGEFRPTDAYPARTIAYHCWVTVHGLAMLHTTILKDEIDEMQTMTRQILSAVIKGFLAT